MLLSLTLISSLQVKAHSIILFWYKLYLYLAIISAIQHVVFPAGALEARVRRTELLWQIMSKHESSIVFIIRPT